jgi:hypothetical protein
MHHFWHPKVYGNSITFVGPLVNHVFFYQQFAFFKLTMQNHCQATMLLPLDYNPTTHLWERLGHNGILNHRLLEWFKFVKLCMVMVLGNVKDEHTFSNLVLMKSKL